MKNIIRIALVSAIAGVSFTKMNSLAQVPIEDTRVDIFLTFTEPVAAKHCSLQNVGGGPGQGFCGSGEVVPLGHAEETIEFSAACGGACDLRTINLAEGSI